MAKVERKVTTYVLDERELEEVLDREAMARLGMSGADFLRAYHEGTLPDTPAVTELVMLVHLRENADGRELSKRLR